MRWLLVAGTTVLTLACSAAVAAESGQRSEQRRMAEVRRDLLEVRRAEDQAQRDAALARRALTGRSWIPDRPMVLPNGRVTAAPDYGRDLQLAYPWRPGSFTRGVGPQYVWQLQGGGRRLFELGGRHFALASADYGRANAWRWSRDTVVLYADVQHEGWYLAYNVRTATYAHVRYVGA